MKAAVYDATGGPEVLRYADVPDPVCPRQGLLVRHEAISIEGGDTVNRWRGAMASVPHVVGYQAAGEVLEVGPEASVAPDGRPFRVGQKVVTTGAHGSHADLRAGPARTAWPVPDGMDVRLAATVPIPFGTADAALFTYGRLAAGETVLVQAGASGVGLAAIQLAKRAGARVLATASSDERLAALEPYGLDEGINYADADPVSAVMELTDGRGADLVLDGNGGRSLEGSLAVLGWKGRVSFYGFSSREPSRVDLSSLLAGNRSVTGLSLASEIRADRVRARIGELIDMVAAGELRMPIDRTFPLADAAAAHAYLESRRAVGRVLLIP